MFMPSRKFVSGTLKLIAFIIYPIVELYQYFVFIGLLCMEERGVLSWTILVAYIAYHLLLAYKSMFYMRLLVTEDKSTLDIFPDLPCDESNLEIRNINSFVEERIMKDNLSRIKICGKCKTYKPPRAHHCNVCKRCYLKYDHHCLMLGVCIGFHNYKFFYQFLFMNLVTCLFLIIFVSVYMTVSGWIAFQRLVNYIILLSLTSVELVFISSLLVFHTWLIGMNETTIEHYVIDDYISGDHTFGHVFQEGPITSLSTSTDRQVLNPYNLGLGQNWKQVFGNSFRHWLMPTYSTPGNGVSFPKNYNKYYEFLY
ncbi:Palmitoyltransferase zdhhc20 [Ordospora colligata]